MGEPRRQVLAPAFVERMNRICGLPEAENSVSVRYRWPLTGFAVMNW